MSADKETLRLRQLFQNIMEINRPDISVDRWFELFEALPLETQLYAAHVVLKVPELSGKVAISERFMKWAMKNYDYLHK